MVGLQNEVYIVKITLTAFLLLLFFGGNVVPILLLLKLGLWE